MKRVICFFVLCLMLFCLSVGCHHGYNDVLTTNETEFGYDFDGGEVAEIASNLDSDSLYYTLYVFKDNNVPSSSNLNKDCLNVSFFFCEDKTLLSDVEDYEYNDLPPTLIRFGNGSEWKEYECYKTMDNKLAIVTDSEFTNMLYSNSKLEVKLNTYEGNFETFVFDISKIHKL